MKLLKLSVDYDGYYGGDVHEYCLLPFEWNGLYCEKLEEGLHDRAVYLGEIEGKHSEVYGDLTVEIIDLSELNKKELTLLIKNSSVSEFECTFEVWEDDFINENEDDLDVIKINQNSFEVTNTIKFNSEWDIKSCVISEKLIESLNHNTVTFEEIIVKKSDLSKVIELLKHNNIEIF